MATIFCLVKSECWALFRGEGEQLVISLNLVMGFSVCRLRNARLEGKKLPGAYLGGVSIPSLPSLWSFSGSPCLFGFQI